MNFQPLAISQHHYCINLSRLCPAKFCNSVCILGLNQRPFPDLRTLHLILLCTLYGSLSTAKSSAGESTCFASSSCKNLSSVTWPQLDHHPRKKRDSSVFNKAVILTKCHRNAFPPSAASLCMFPLPQQINWFWSHQVYHQYNLPQVLITFKLLTQRHGFAGLKNILIKCYNFWGCVTILRQWTFSLTSHAVPLVSINQNTRWKVIKIYLIFARHRSVFSPMVRYSKYKLFLAEHISNLKCNGNSQTSKITFERISAMLCSY